MKFIFIKQYFTHYYFKGSCLNYKCHCCNLYIFSILETAGWVIKNKTIPTKIEFISILNT